MPGVIMASSPTTIHYLHFTIKAEKEFDTLMATVGPEISVTHMANLWRLRNRVSLH